MTRTSRVLLFLSSLITPAAVLAAPPEPSFEPLSDYTVISWATKDGLPGERVWSIAQDQDDFLWLGTDAGLVRFDGTRFLLANALGLNLPRSGVSVVRTGGDGSLWIGFSEIGGVARIQRGEVQQFGEAHGLGEWPVRTLNEDREGVWWAGTDHGLFAWRSGRWLPITVDEFARVGRIQSAHVDSSGDLLVATGDAVYRKRADSSDFRRVDHVSGVRAIWEHPRGTLWRTDASSGLLPLDASELREPATLRGRGLAALADSRGDVWVSMAGFGVWRIRSTAPAGVKSIERVSTSAGLAGDTVWEIREDRFHNIWIGSTGGLTQLKRQRVRPFWNLGIGRAIAPAKGADVLVLGDDQLFQLTDDDRSPASIKRRRFDGVPQALYVAANGETWIASRDSLTSGDGTAFPLTIPSGGVLSSVSMLAVDRDGAPWLYDTDRGLFTISDRKLRAIALPASLEHERALSMLTDSTGSIWMGFRGGRVAVLRPGHGIDVFGEEHGLLRGNYTGLWEDDDHTFWLANSEGLTTYRDGRFASFGRRNGFPWTVVSVVSDTDGYLWLGTSEGLVRVHPREVDAKAQDSSYEMRHVTLDRTDGMAAFPHVLAWPNAARAHDGHLWFLTGNGASEVDPHLIDEPGRMNLKVEGVIADSKRVSRLDGVFAIPPRTARVEIQYAAVNLLSPTRTRFRYRLDGFDSDWVEAAQPSHAVYTNLAPRQYVFRLMADSGNGVWASPESTIALVVQPQFHQTPWFYAGVAVFGIGFGWMLWLHRAQQVRRHTSAVFAERLRLAHEIHDTLLQRLVGVGLQLDALASTGEVKPQTKERLIRLRAIISASINEARSTILNLRSPQLGTDGLIETIREVGHRVVGDATTVLKFRVLGTPAGCPPGVEHQVARIAEEAMANAIQHAGARNLGVELEYMPHRLVLRVVDDGGGFDTDAFVLTGEHFGIVTMKERAKEVGGRIQLESTVGRGTHVEAEFPI